MCTLGSALRYVSVVALFVMHGGSMAQVNEVTCGPINLAGQVGPFDYRTAAPDVKRQVEGVHFTPDVEALRRGGTTSISGDLDYTLRILPNNYRALNSLAKLRFRENKDRLQGMHWPVECYFERAVRYAPDDPMVRQVYGYYLVRMGRKQEALAQIETASSLGVNSANLHYNLGLLYFEVGEFDKSMEHAWKAYQAGYDLPGLKAKLKAAGKWKEPS
jgi:Tfp pilus assembly protein PilF